jgi:hypothetical protein
MLSHVAQIGLLLVTAGAGIFECYAASKRGMVA